MAIVRCERPWKLPVNTMTFGRPVACLASFTAASVASAPELAKKNWSMPAGRDGGQPGRQGLEQVVAVAVDLGVHEPRRLGLDGGDHVRVAMAGGRHRDAGGEVEVLGAVHRRDPRAVTRDHLQVGHREPHRGEVGRHGRMVRGRLPCPGAVGSAVTVVPLVPWSVVAAMVANGVSASGRRAQPVPAPIRRPPVFLMGDSTMLIMWYHPESQAVISEAYQHVPDFESCRRIITPSCRGPVRVRPAQRHHHHAGQRGPSSARPS